MEGSYRSIESGLGRNRIVFSRVLDRERLEEMLAFIAVNTGLVIDCKIHDNVVFGEFLRKSGPYHDELPVRRESFNAFAEIRSR